MPDEIAKGKTVRVFGGQFFDAAAEAIQKHTGIAFDEYLLDGGRADFFSMYYPPIGHNLIDTLHVRPDLNPKTHAEEIFQRIVGVGFEKAAGELAQKKTDKKEEKKDAPEDPKTFSEPVEILKLLLRSCFEGPYHSSFLGDLTAVEDWFGRCWIRAAKPTADDEMKIADKLSRSIIDGRRLLREWRNMDWEAEKLNTGQYL